MRRPPLAPTVAAVLLGSAVLLPDLACNRPARGTEDAPSAEQKRTAADLFATRCATCHGPRGRGDGPAASALSPRPRDLTDRNWQASVTDDYLEKIIASGGPAVGKSPSMPANPDLFDKPAIVRALRAHIRGLPTR